jgi:hypothetical protein
MDIDADGDLDLIRTAGLSGWVVVLPQLLPGRFAEAPFVLGDRGNTGDARAVAIVDLDGNGDLDLVRSGNGGLSVHLQPFHGPSGAAVVVGRGTQSRPRSVAAGDLDGDGDLDLVSANEFGHNLTAFLQGNPGSFGTDPLVIGGIESTPFVRSVAAVDLDGDGDLDLASMTESGGLVVFDQTAPQSFADVPLIIETGPGLSAEVADLDGDGDQDLVATTDAGLQVFSQLSPGSFAVPSSVLGHSAGWPGRVAAADLDADGDLDLVTQNDEFDHLTVSFQDSPGNFGAVPLILGGAGMVGPLSVGAGDLDGDGDLDLASANGESGNLTVFFQSSPGSFATLPLVVGGPGTTVLPFSLALSDLDGDGDQDLVSANVGSNDLTVFLQLAPGTFGTTPLALGLPDTTVVPVWVVAADLDGDGDQDLASANQDGNSLALFFGGR